MLICSTNAGSSENRSLLKELYDKILADDEMVEWLNDTMLLEGDNSTGNFPLHIPHGGFLVPH